MATAAPAKNERNKPDSAPRGTILKGGVVGCYWVRGSAAWYWLDTNEGTCDCPHFWYRLKRGDRCKHLDLLARYLAAPD